MEFDTLLTPEYVRKYEESWPNRTILDYLEESIEKHPEKLAIADKNSRYTYRQLGEVVDRVALGLLELGLKKGDVISFQLPNCNEFIILHFAATRIGAISNPLVPIYRDREIQFMLKTAEAKMVVVPDVFRKFDYAAMINRIIDSLDTVEHVFVVGDNVPENMKPFSELLDEPWEEKRDRTELDRIVHDSNDLTAIMFTSGTTGQPKGVMHTHNTLCVSTDYVIDHLQLNDGDVIFSASTFAHLTGFLYGARMPAQCGGTGIYQDVWDPEEFIQLVSKERISFKMGATPFLSDTIQVEGIEKYDLSSFKYFVTAGAPIPPAVVKEAKQKIPCKVFAGWGQTENGLVTLTSPTDSEEKLIGTDGHPIQGMHVKVVDELGETCPPNVEGNLLCKGPALFVGYLKRLEDTRNEFNGEWFVTGDRAFMDEDGYIRIAGRLKDIIIRGGENIPVAYVENVLYEHEAIDVVQVVGMPDPRLQEKACAFVKMKSGKSPLTLNKIQQFLNEKGVTKQYWPEHLEIVEEFPRTASGKIQKFQLREQIKQKISN